MSRQIQEFDRLAAARRADLRELCAEFQAAISALTASDLEALKTSIEKQEKLASRLQSLVQEGGFLGDSSAIPEEALDLIYVTRLYSALLQRSMRTASLRSALCQTYEQQLAKAGDATSETSWSCEV